MFRKILLLLFTAAGLMLLLPNMAQKTPARPAIEKAMDAKDYKTAGTILKSDIDSFLSAGNLDTIVSYISFTGKIAHALYGSPKATEEVNALISLLKSNNARPSLLVKAYREAADFFANTGQNQQGYDASEEALNYAMQDPNRTEQEIARCEYNLGTYAHRLGNVGLSQKHHRRALEIRVADKNTEAEDIYLSSNAMGSLMWYASRYDSAAILYNKALEALKKMPDNDLNKYFRPANIQNNLAALYSAEGKTSEGISAMQSTIGNFQQFIASKTPDPKKQSATEGLFEAIDNLAGIYKEIGDYGKRGDLLRYSYQQKMAKLNQEHPGIFISEILLGQHYTDIYEYDTAMHYLTRGLEKLEKAEGDYLFWAADAYYTLALIHENRKNIEKARDAYGRSEALYEQSYQGQYDNMYMDFLRSASLFYAKNNDYRKAMERAEKVYRYLVEMGEGNSLQAFYQQLNMAEINYLTRHYPEAIRYCNTALNTVNEKMKDGLTRLDSVKMEVFKPKAILIGARAEYALQKKRDTVFLRNLSLRLEEALDILEKRKVMIDDAASINILIADHRELIDFAKKIAFELYESSGRSSYLDDFINLHESGLYNRIRSRFDKQQAIRFSGLPVSVQEEEQQLKLAMTSSLQSEKPDSAIKKYLAAVANWESYLDRVRKEHTLYYNMRYATIFKSLPELQSALPDSTTVVRYFFVDSSLIAIVADKQEKRIVRLARQGIEEKISQALLHMTNEKMQLPVLHELYKILWEPLESFVHTSKVMIIPDGAIYNLSFDMLTSAPLQSYRDLLSGALLSRYIFSYHYSLFMLGHSMQGDDVKKNYIAFAPGFSDEVKKSYLSVAKDSVNLDYRYLQLLPQPNTNRLVKKIKRLLGGDAYLDESSTQASFRSEAGGHKIIHIGTHARYDNIHPEQSGLIFAKNTPADSDTNFLFLHDIYNCDLQSDLTVLTACESGRPGYQDGEGMVSLAHAFNYAGSERILTALWKIDEQSSSKITEIFVDYLKNGYPTDEALREAKLKYLAQAEGRLSAPAYWAGLVMMGEPASISLHPASTNIYWIAAGMLLLILLILALVVYRKRGRNQTG